VPIQKSHQPAHRERRGDCGDGDPERDRRDASRFEVYEQTFKISDQEILTVLVLTDEEMLEEVA